MNQSRRSDAQSEFPEGLSPAAMRRMLQELQVQHNELEVQNQELRRTQAELADTQTRYIDLYDQAPVGYLTLSTEGLILEANSTAATLLSVARAALVTEPISRFIGKEYQESFRQH